MDILTELRKPRETYDAGNGTQIQCGECYGCYDKQRALAADQIEAMRNLVSDLIDLLEELPANHPSQITRKKILLGQADIYGAYQPTVTKEK